MENPVNKNATPTSTKQDLSAVNVPVDRDRLEATNASDLTACEIGMASKKEARRQNVNHAQIRSWAAEVDKITALEQKDEAAGGAHFDELQGEREAFDFASLSAFLKETAAIAEAANMPPTVYVLNITHRHGHNVHVCASRQKAEKLLAAYCRDNWEQEGVPDDIDGLCQSEIFSTYFAHMGGEEDYTIEAASLEADEEEAG